MGALVLLAGCASGGVAEERAADGAAPQEPMATPYQERPEREGEVEAAGATRFVAPGASWAAESGAGLPGRCALAIASVRGGVVRADPDVVLGVERALADEARLRRVVALGSVDLLSARAEDLAYLAGARGFDALLLETEDEAFVLATEGGALVLRLELGAATPGGTELAARVGGGWQQARR